MRTRNSPSAHLCLRAVLACCVLGVSGAAGAQDIAAAEALFNSGLADMKVGHYDTGCKAIAESQRLDPRPGTLFTLATCEMEWGHIATAVTRYGDYIGLYERMPDDRKEKHADRYKLAQEARERLAPDVPHLTLSLPKGAPAGTLVKRDGELVAEAALGLAIPVDPGPHTISTQAPGGTVVEQPITLAKGEKKEVTLDVRVSTTVAPSPTDTVAPGSTGPSGRRIATYVVGGVGLAGLVGGGVMGALALGQKGILDKHCGTAVGQTDKASCDPTGLDASSNAQSMALRPRQRSCCSSPSQRRVLQRSGRRRRGARDSGCRQGCCRLDQRGR